MKIAKLIVAAAMAAAVGACATSSPITYANLADTTVALRKYSARKAAIVSMDDQSGFEPNCRLYGPIQGGGNRPVPVFIRDSFNDELKFANVYGEGGGAAPLAAVLTKAAFSSTAGVVNGWWEFTIRLTNTRTNAQLTASDRYEFPSGFDALTACNNVGQALTPAVQRLIYRAVSDPAFVALIR